MKITIPENWFVPKSKNRYDDYDVKQKLDRFIELQSTKESSFLPNDKNYIISQFMKKYSGNNYVSVPTMTT